MVGASSEGRPESGLTPVERALVARAIGDAEVGNRGEVRVHIERVCPTDDPVARAQEVFDELGIRETDAATGVLLYIADGDRKCAVYADDGVFGAREGDFWREVIESVADGYRKGEPVSGIVAALGTIGELLRATVPGEDEAGDELPDEVTTG